MKSSTYESVRFDRFVLGSPHVLFDCASRVERQKFDIDSDVEPPPVPNLMHKIKLKYFFQWLLTALMIGCTVTCNTWRELTEPWWPLAYERVLCLGKGWKNLEEREGKRSLSLNREPVHKLDDREQCSLNGVLNWNILELDPQLKTVDLQRDCINTTYISIYYLYLNMIAISLNINGIQQKKLLQLGDYKCSN